MNPETSFERLQAQTVGEAAEPQTSKHSERATALRIPNGQTFGEGSAGIQRIARTQTPARFREALSSAWCPERGEALREKGRAHLRVPVAFLQSRMAGKELHRPEGRSRENRCHRFR